MKKLIHLSLLQGVLKFTLDASGQNVPVYNIPSPEVASLGTFGTIPVGLFTGTPEISISLHEVKAGDYTLPIRATYHLSSVKPNTPGGPLGLGWNLDAGGFISRTVRFYPDEMSSTRHDAGYAYDCNGNLTSDLNRGISSITYNLLNLPARISWSDGSTVSYRYDADGTLLREDRTIYIQTQFGRKVYFPQSRRIYQIRLHQRPLLISTR